jgi:hypothetical protein
MDIGHQRRIVMVFVAAVLLLLPLSNAHAVPSFARQVGVDCTACHIVFFELTQFGRSFKLHGYTMTNVTQGQSEKLKENYYPPVSAMLLVSYTHLSNTQPNTQNGNVLLPDTLSLFYAGRISDKLGAYAQITYSQPADHFTMDNTDIRYADEMTNLVYGFTFNNNPTVQDPWNSTPAWGFPFVSSSVAPAPAASTQLVKTNAQKVAGLGAYGFWNDLIYGELTFYRSAQVGGNVPPNSATDTSIVDGVAPYWRFAAEKNWGNHSLEAGTYGLYVKKFPGGGMPFAGPTDHFKDYAFDAQYQYITDPHAVTAHTTWIREKQDWDASFPAGLTSNASDKLTTFKIDGIYYYKRTIGGSLGYFSTRGDMDANLYPAGDLVSGSANGSPDSSGWTVEVDYLPWLNTKFIVQYTMYDKFNGAKSDYTGSGRSARDNNTLYVAAWLMF